MSSLVIGQWDGATGSVTTTNDEGAGSAGVNFAVGAFTGTGGLPTVIASEGDFFSFASALEAKTTETFDGGVRVQMSSDRFAGVGGGGRDIFDIANAGSATISGHGGDDRLTSRDGNDNLYGEGGDDVLNGGGGFDYCDGGAGDDKVAGGVGDDTLQGGADVDTVVVAPSAAPYTAVKIDLDFATLETNLTTFGATLSGFENAEGSAIGDEIIGNALANVLAGADGGDTVSGGAGADSLYGGLGNDSITGEDQNDLMNGGGGSDAMAGGGGADTLIGAAGKDLITGGANGDEMSGGAGKDRFVYNTIADTFTAQADRITDLEAQDRILLTNIDAKTDRAGNQAFDLVGALTGNSGEAVLVYDAGADETQLRLDVDGDGTADGVIVLDGDQTGFVNFAL